MSAVPGGGERPSERQRLADLLRAMAADEPLESFCLDVASDEESSRLCADYLMARGVGFPASAREREPVSKLRRDAENVLTWEAPTEGDPLLFGHLRRFAKAVLNLTALAASEQGEQK